MKREWVKPQTVVEKFTANEYVALCADQGTHYGNYKFVCDAGGGRRGDVVVGGRNLTAGTNVFFHSCGETHEAPTRDEFYDGVLVLNGGNDKATDRYGRDYQTIPVVVWTDGNTNVHCTKNLDRESWEVVKS